MSHFHIEIDTTPTDQACIILHHDEGDEYGPITGDYRRATSWKFLEALHQQIFDYEMMIYNLADFVRLRPRSGRTTSSGADAFHMRCRGRSICDGESAFCGGLQASVVGADVRADGPFQTPPAVQR